MFPGIEHLVDQIFTHLVQEYSLFVGLGAYILVVIALSTISLMIMLIVASVWFPYDLAKKIWRNCKDLKEGD